MLHKEIVKHLIDLVLYLGRHSLSFRGHKEGWKQNIRGNYKDLVILLAKYSLALVSYITSVELKGRKIINFYFLAKEKSTNSSNFYKYS